MGDAVQLRAPLARTDGADAGRETRGRLAAGRRVMPPIMERCLPPLLPGVNLDETQQAQILDLATRSHLPTICMFKVWADAGCFLADGPSLAHMWYQAGVFAGKLLNGAKPADLPVEQPTKFELVINLKTAKALGLTIPPSVLARADEVIE